MNGRVYGPPFAAPAFEGQCLQFAFEDLETPLLRLPHLGRVRPGRGIHPAKVQQQLLNVRLQAGVLRAGEDFPYRHRRGGNFRTFDF
jgi:hypothetical protein